MPMKETLVPYTLGLLPKPEQRPGTFFTSALINFLLLGLFVVMGMTAKRVMDQHKYEQTVLIFPTTPPPPLKLRIPQPRVHPPRPPEAKLEPPKIALPKIEPEIKPIRMEASAQVPIVKSVHPAIVLAPQPKAALAAAAPAQVQQAKPVIASVHLGETFGVAPNPNAVRPATVAAIGNPYGGMTGPAVAPRGVVGSTGIGNGTVSGSSSGYGSGRVGRVASAGIPGMVASAAPLPQTETRPTVTSLLILSKPPAQYTLEARQLKIQGDVVLRVTFTAAGQVLVHGIVQSLGHGLDEEARRVAQQIQFRPASRNGQAMDLTTNITITFQLA
jgi:TonB family protein